VIRSGRRGAFSFQKLNPNGKWIYLRNTLKPRFGIRIVGVTEMSSALGGALMKRKIGSSWRHSPIVVRVD